MMRGIHERSRIARALCVLCVGLVFALGTAQAVHSHPVNAQTDRHSCSICSAPSMGPAATTVAFAPTANPVAIAGAAREEFVTYRPVLTNFVRPPPAV